VTENPNKPVGSDDRRDWVAMRIECRPRRPDDLGLAPAVTAGMEFRRNLLPDESRDVLCIRTKV